MGAAAEGGGAGVGPTLEEVRKTFRSGKTREESWRRSQLKALMCLLQDREHDLVTALKQDLGKPHVESFKDEIGPLLKSVDFALANLNTWMSGIKAKLPLAAFPVKAEIIPEPLGVVLIFSSWNFPIGLSLEPMIGAIAAGCVGVLKPSEQAPACSSLLAELIPAYLDPNAFKVIEGGALVSEVLLDHKWDKIFFTGSVHVGRAVMTAAAKHLTPVTLELGGKCPAVVDSLSRSWDKDVALNRIIAGKFGVCSGQACIGIDYILVEKKFCNELVELMKKYMKQQFGQNQKEMQQSLARIVNKKHFLRLKILLDEAQVKSSLVYGGLLDEENLFIGPTLVVDPPLDSAVMTEEIFGPILPIITMERIEDSIEFFNSRPKPLTIYAFTHNESLMNMLASQTSSGSLVFNDAIIQYAADTLPFGGVGESGIGRYHGKFSFDTFSHEKTVAKRSFLIDFWFRYPPWNPHKLQLLKAGYRFDYLSFVLILLGLKKTY
ncbi:unnamed protein product [Cuscuta campestris]|uniref:Aldehyde dehydrogenase n=1 Tax=Cuscuta campestris TaxID=132261 RepID=A0A484LFT2_9ASTE|nr:unnamed protein product [Cuscuta campestris]